MRLKRQFREQGVLNATIYLETSDLNLGEIASVEIFGEFSERPWEHRIRCCKSSTISTLYSADLKIKIGQKFKFIIDNGRAYTTSDHYLKTTDEAGNTNNIFQFHERSNSPGHAVYFSN